jgi:hypothetical protein
MELMARLPAVAMAVEAAAALAPALMISLILSRVDSAELAVEAVAEELTNLVRRLPEAAALLAEAEVPALDPLTTPLPRVARIWEISVEDLVGLARIPSDQALAAEAAAVEAVSEALSLSIAL